MRARNLTLLGLLASPAPSALIRQVVRQRSAHRLIAEVRSGLAASRS
jgi:hypothetical protein